MSTPILDGPSDQPADQPGMASRDAVAEESRAASAARRPLTLADFFPTDDAFSPVVRRMDLFGIVPDVFAEGEKTSLEHASRTHQDFNVHGDFILPATVMAEAAHEAATAGGRLMATALSHTILASIVQRPGPMPDTQRDVAARGRESASGYQTLRRDLATTSLWGRLYQADGRIAKYASRLFRLRTPPAQVPATPETAAALVRLQQEAEVRALAVAGAYLWNALSILGPAGSYEEIASDDGGWTLKWAKSGGAPLFVARDGTLCEVLAGSWRWGLHSWRNRLVAFFPSDAFAAAVPRLRDRMRLARQAREERRRHRRAGVWGDLPPRLPWAPSRRDTVWSVEETKSRLMAWILSGLDAEEMRGGMLGEMRDRRPVSRTPLVEQDLQAFDAYDRALTPYEEPAWYREGRR